MVKLNRWTKLIGLVMTVGISMTLIISGCAANTGTPRAGNGQTAIPTAPAPKNELATKLSKAASWAKEQIGVSNIDWIKGTNTYCEVFVENAFGTSGTYADAYTAFQSIGVSGSPQTPGQIVFFDKNDGNGGNGHSGIYIGNDQFISVTNSGVRQASLSGWSSDVASYVGYANPPSTWPGQ